VWVATDDEGGAQRKLTHTSKGSSAQVKNTCAIGGVGLTTSYKLAAVGLVVVNVWVTNPHEQRGYKT